jgi:glyoxylase-like metal-dependent hydrolase (beta-lactamase superfamily II)
VHWDHIGEPLDFPTSTFVVGHGALALLNGTSSALRGGHSFFEHDLLPEGRTVELSDPNTITTAPNHEDEPEAGKLSMDREWKNHGSLPKTLDLFGDGSVFIVDAPGHLPGHINLLIHTSSSESIYLAGDVCHDRRLLTGEKEIGTWEDGEGHVCCIHSDRGKAEETIRLVRGLEGEGVEVVLAHDDQWEIKAQKEGRFFGIVEGG